MQGEYKSQASFRYLWGPVSNRSYLARWFDRAAEWKYWIHAFISYHFTLSSKKRDPNTSLVKLGSLQRMTYIKYVRGPAAGVQSHTVVLPRGTNIIKHSVENYDGQMNYTVKI